MKNTSPIILSLLTTLGFFGCIFWMLKWGFPQDNKDPLNQLLGVLGTIWTLQMNYTFGSSASSTKKDETISDIAKMPISGTGSGVGGRATDTAIPAKDVSVVAEGDVTVKTDG